MSLNTIILSSISDVHEQLERVLRNPPFPGDESNKAETIVALFPD